MTAAKMKLFMVFNALKRSFLKKNLFLFLVVKKIKT